MTNEPIALLQRLDDIGRSLSNTPNALALIGLGSVGQETDRLDQYSDLDFFVIVESGCQQHFMEDLSWLTGIAPIAFHFPNTSDGYKLLFEDGIFCEFAIFDPPKLAKIPFASGRIIWKAAVMPDSIAHPPPAAPNQPKTEEWLLGEILTNLYVGLSREKRGERLSAMQFIQGFAVDRLTALSAYVETAVLAHLDLFDNRRRYETRYPGLAAHLPQFLQGYNKNRESAQAILTFLDQHFDLNQAIKEKIKALLR
jgi:hypothetical protein